MTRRRRRGRGGVRGASTLGLAALLAALVVAPAVVPGTASFTAGDVPRSASVDVSRDEDSLLELDAAAAVTAGETDRLVNVTNHFGADATVTVTLRSNSTADLVYDGTNVGDQTTFTLGPGSTGRVSVAVANGTTDPVRFDVDASTTGVTVHAPGREVTVS